MPEGVILCRAGSSLADKNMRLVGGRPLCEWVIGRAVRSSLTGLTVVTDCPGVSGVAQACGADVVDRPSELSGPDTSGFDVLRWLGRSEAIVVLQVTSPFTSIEDINVVAGRALAHDVVVSVVAMSLPVLDSDGISMLQGRFDRRQVAAPRYVPNGALFRFTPAVYASSVDWTGEQVDMYEMPPERSLDIDTEWDLRIANLCV